MSVPIAVFAILRGKDRPYGRLQVEEINEWNYGVSFFVGHRPAGFFPVKKGLGKNIAIALAAKHVKTFARQHKCSYIQRDGGELRKVEKREKYENRLSGGRLGEKR